jgi:predicted TIM-barrel fold metal-dependent hydrolase
MTRVFDFHARLRPGPAAVADLLAVMDRTGIARAAVAAGGLLDLRQLSAQIVHGGQSTVDADNGFVLSACAGSAGRLVPIYFANPHDQTGAYRREGHRFRGVEISPAVHGLGFDDARVAALVRVAAEHGHAVYTVCAVAPGAGTDDLVALASSFPEVMFVFGHCGFIALDAHALETIAPHPNILVETSGCFSVTVRLAVLWLGAHRVLFGTEYPLQHPSVELAKFAALELPAEQWRRIAWDNARTLVAA